MPGTWTPLANQPTFTPANVILLTDGTVMVQELERPFWHRLTPDHHGDYVHGTWGDLASTTGLLAGGSDYGPLEYGAAVLADGTVLIIGGELNYDRNGNQLAGNLNTVARFDPTRQNGTGAWTLLASPPFPGYVIADSSCCVLADGRVLAGSAGPAAGGSQLSALLDPGTWTWTQTPNNPGVNNEVTWTLLPDGTVLSPCISQSPHVYKYVPAHGGAGQWVQDADYPAAKPLATTSDGEIGPAILLPNGTVIAFGVTGHNAVYTPPASNPSSNGAWAETCDFPLDSASRQLRCSDAPAALLTNGNVLVMAGHLESGGHSGQPVTPFEYAPNANPANATFVSVPAPSSFDPNVT